MRDTPLYRPLWHDQSIDRIFSELLREVAEAPKVNTGHWQAKKNVPQVESRELLNVRFEIPVSASSGGWASYMHPNLPWAEQHFRERVSRQPLNPPPSHVDWPYNQKANAEHMDGEVFSHSYPERLWPKFAGHDFTLHLEATRVNETLELSRSCNSGIRYRYGDLDDLVTLLTQEPHTRQAYVPLWFPEDLAAAVGEQRVPCTLGYHFILRDGKLHCFYPMRSLDVLRYFKDDAYMAGRLCQWLITQCRGRRTDDDSSIWHEVIPGILTIHAVSCHVFEGDLPIIKQFLSKENKVPA